MAMARLMVTNVGSMNMALTCSVFIHPDNHTFGDNTNVKIGNFVYELEEDDSISPEQIAMGGVIRRELGVSVGDAVDVVSFEQSEADKKQNTILVKVHVDFLKDSDKGMGLYDKKFLERKFWGLCEGKYVTVGQHFIIMGANGGVLKFMVRSITSAILSSEGEPAFYPNEPIVHATIDSEEQIEVFGDILKQ